MPVLERQPPRVLHLAQPTDGGVARCVVDLAADQHRRGWDVVVGCPDGGILADQLEACGVPRVHWDAARAGRAATPHQLRHLGRIVKATAPDLVHLHSASAGLTGRLVLRRRVPTIFQPHGWSWQAVSGNFARAVRLWERAGARWSDVIVCVSEAERDNGVRAGVRARYEVVPNGVDLTRYPAATRADQLAARGELGLLDQPTALCVGRFDVQKGHANVIRAWRAVLDELPSAQLALVGSGMEEDALRALCRELGLGTAVVFAGERSDVARWYAACDFLVFPSRWGEGMALTPLEAMSSARPVVASSVAGVAESVGPGCGELVGADDIPALVAALTARLADPAATMREGLAARAHAERVLDIRRSHDRIARLSVDLVRRGKA